MILSRQQQFVPRDMLHTMHNELLNGNNWVYRGSFWRYYLIDGLAPYVESDESTWYGNQLPALNASLKGHWRKLFDMVLEFAGSNFVLQRYALTGQTQGQEQVMHTDTSTNVDGNFKSYLLYLNTDWDVAWGGLTEFAVDNSTIHCEIPEPGKLVVFDSKMLHRGQGPNCPNVLRLSVVLHGKHV